MRRVVVLIVALALAGAACLPEGSPQNGQLPDSSLTTVTPECRLVHDVAGRLQNLLFAAYLDGISLAPETKSYAFFEPPRITSCYRDLEMQQWWRDYYCFFGACGMAAVPGTSVHGWGRAVDFESAGEELRFDHRAFLWLFFHAGEFGFVHPDWAHPDGANPEPWHWEAA